MACKEPGDGKQSSSPKVEIKLEPGTSNLPLLNYIKIEPGLSGSTTRLTSFRVPRDLTLGASIKTEKPKRIFTPNVNVERNKKKEDVPTIKKERKPARERGRGRGQNDRGRGRGKSSNLIQSVGAFSEGINTSCPMKRRSGRYSTGDDKSEARAFMEKPVLNLEQTVDKAVEEAKLKKLLKDDFIDDGMDSTSDNAPIPLPLNDEDTGNFNSMKFKTDPDVKQKDRKPQITVPQIIENQSNGYMMIQLPDCLPGLRVSEESESRSRGQKEQTETSKTENLGKSQFCTLNCLKGGFLGKIQILKSGRTRLVIGNNTMYIDIGSKPGFRQDLVAAKVESDITKSELVNLGQVNDTLICSPDWESMLAAL